MEIVILILIVLGLILIGSWALGLVFSLIWWVLIGALIGFVARLMIPEHRRSGILGTVLAGIAGSLLGGVLANAFDVGRILQFVLAVIVAAVLILAFAGREGATAS
ncbi:MAG: GlsB/YeaQ/YmgE family stress response membrane protein [Thermoleophilia bacterium]